MFTHEKSSSTTILRYVQLRASDLLPFQHQVLLLERWQSACHRCSRHLSRLPRLVLCGLGLAGWLIVAATSLSAQDTLSGTPSAVGTSEQPRESINLPEVRRLIRGLTSDQLSERDAAEKQLLQIGAAVLPFLPEISSSTSGELKVRLQRLRSQLQTSQISSFFAASRLSLSGKMPLLAALEKVSQQSGNRIHVENSTAYANTEIDLVADQQPFWQVMDQILAQAELHINAFSSQEGISLAANLNGSPIPSPLPSIEGPFQLQVLSVQTSKQFGSQLAGQLDVALQLNWEPRLKPIYVQLPMNKMKASAEDGSEQLATNPQASPEIPLNSAGCSAQIDLQLTRPPRSARKLATISGELVVAVPSEKHKFVFERFTSGKRQSEKFGEVTVTLESARRNGSVYEVRILTEFQETQGALDSFRGWILSNRAYLLDRQQQPLQNVGFQSYAVTNNAVGMAFLFQINGEPNEYMLIYESPGLITRQTVPFVIKDIDLP